VSNGQLDQPLTHPHRKVKQSPLPNQPAPQTPNAASYKYLGCGLLVYGAGAVPAGDTEGLISPVL